MSVSHSSQPNLNDDDQQFIKWLSCPTQTFLFNANSIVYLKNLTKWLACKKNIKTTSCMWKQLAPLVIHQSKAYGKNSMLNLFSLLITVIHILNYRNTLLNHYWTVKDWRDSRKLIWWCWIRKLIFGRFSKVFIKKQSLKHKVMLSWLK